LISQGVPQLGGVWRQTTVGWHKQVFIHTRLLRAYLALAIGSHVVNIRGKFLSDVTIIGVQSDQRAQSASGRPSHKWCFTTRGQEQVKVRSRSGYTVKVTTDVGYVHVVTASGSNNKTMQRKTRAGRITLLKSTDSIPFLAYGLRRNAIRCIYYYYSLQR